MVAPRNLASGHTVDTAVQYNVELKALTESENEETPGNTPARGNYQSERDYLCCVCMHAYT